MTELASDGRFAHDTKSAPPCNNALSEWRRCRGGEFEPEGSVLKYVTEGENEAGAADLLMTQNLLTHATMLCQNGGDVVAASSSPKGAY